MNVLPGMIAPAEAQLLQLQQFAIQTIGTKDVERRHISDLFTTPLLQSRCASLGIYMKWWTAMRYLDQYAAVECPAVRD